MMNNLQSSAFVAKTTQLLSSVARLRLLLVMLLTLTVSANVRGATETITITQTALGLGGSYTSSSKTIDGVTFDWTDLMKNSSDIQAKATSGAIWNSSPIPGNIVSVAVTHSGTARSSTMYFGASAKSTTESSTFSGTATTAPEGKYKYFYIKRSSNAAYWTKIVITYETTPAVNHAITWEVNGEDYTIGSPTASVSEGSKVTILPTPPTLDCGGKMFVGWSNQEVTDGNKPSVLFTDAANSPTITEATTFYAVFATENTPGGGSTSKQYSFDITPSDFNSTSYAANNNEKTSTATASDGSSTMEVNWTSYQVMNQSSTMQWQSSKGYIYNSTDLGTIKDITITSTAGTFTKYINDSKQPTSNGTGGYFQIKVGGALGKTSKVTITFTKTTSGAQPTYSDYTTSCTTETVVTLNPNGGTGGTTSVVATNGQPMPTITLPTLAGYVFQGYFTENGGAGDKYYNADGTSAKNWDKEDATFTLYAYWTPQTYTVTLDNQGATTAGATSVTATYNAAMPSIASNLPQKTGYTFNGYFDAASGGTQYYKADGTSAKNWDKTAATTLYAQWECDIPEFTLTSTTFARTEGQEIRIASNATNVPANAKFTWYLNGAEVANQSSSELYIASCTIADAGSYTCTISYDDCSFDSENNYSVKVYSVRGLKGEWDTFHPFVSTSDTEGEFTIYLDANTSFKVWDGEYYYGNPESGTMSGTSENWTMQQNFGGDVTLTNIIAGTYTFKLDYSDASNTKISVYYPSKITVYLNPVSGDAGPYYAIHTWDGSNTENLFMEKVDDCDPYRNIYKAEINASHKNLIFVSTKASTVADMWNQKNYQTIDLTYPTDNDKMLFDMSKLYLTPNSNWKQADARFAAYFFGNGDTWVSMTKVTDNLYEVAIPTNKDYPNVIFCRMNPSSAANKWDNKWNQSPDLTITKDKNHYTITEGQDNWSNGTWSTDGYWTTYTPNHTVSFNANGHGTAPEDQCITDGDKATNPGNLSATGYTFGGWYTDQACNNAWDFENDVVTEDITLYAKWTANIHILTWDVNGGNPLTGTYTSGSVAYGTVIIKPDDPTRTGHTFNGWSPAFEEGTTMPDYDLTYTAQWKFIPTLSWSASSCTAALEADNDYPYLTTNPADLTGITYSSSNTSVATIDDNTGVITLVGVGETTITASFAGNGIYAPAADASYTLTVVESNCKWVEVEIGDIDENDQVVIAMAKTDGTKTWALDNSVTGTYPAAGALLVEGNKISQPLDRYIWNIVATPEGYVLYSYADKTTWLYCTGSNNTVKVGTGSDKKFVIENGYLKCSNQLTVSGQLVDAYIGVSSSTNSWRHYSNTTGVIKDQTLKFYKRECLDSEHYWVTWDANEGTWTDGSSNKLESYQVGAIITKPTDPSREGYRFDGWTPAPTTMPAQNTTFTAVWTQMHTITWMVGSNSVLTEEVANATGVTKTPTDDPTYDAIGNCANAFMGWSETLLGSTEGQPAPADLCTAAQMKANHTSVTGDKTFYAVFATKEGGEDYLQISNESDLVAGSKYLIVGNSSSTYRALPVDNASNLTYVYPSSSKISNPADGLIWTLEGAADRWKIKSTYNNKYLQISGGNLTFVESTALTFNVSVSSSKFTFTSSASSGNKVLSYYHNGNCFNAYNSANTVYIYKQDVSYSNYVTQCCTPWTAPTLSATTSIAVGGSTTITHSGTTHGAVTYTPSNTDIATVDANGKVTGLKPGKVTITATWDGVDGVNNYCPAEATIDVTVTGSFTITYDANHASATGATTATTIAYPTGQGTVATNGFALAEHQFVKWNTSADGSGISYSEGASITLTDDITLYAIWQRYCTITYVIPAGGGTLAAGATTTVVAGGAVQMPRIENSSIDLEYSCEELIGWTTNSATHEAAGLKPDPFYAIGASLSGITQNTTLYAVYSRAGNGVGGTVTLTAQEMEGWSVQQSYGTLRELVTCHGTWKTTGVKSTGNPIQLRATDNPYVEFPELQGNITQVVLNATNGSNATLTSGTFTLKTLDGQTTIASASVNNSGVCTLTVTGSYKTARLYSSVTARITNIAITYGPPAIISTTLNCSSDVDECTITYDLNESFLAAGTTVYGACADATFSFSEIGTYTICATPIANEHQLLGWNNQCDGKGLINYTPGQVISSLPQNNIVLYAQWAPQVIVHDSYEETFVYPTEAGGSITLNPGTQGCNPKKYDFIGWTDVNPLIGNSTESPWNQTNTPPTLLPTNLDGTVTYTPDGPSKVYAVYAMEDQANSSAFVLSSNVEGATYYVGYDSNRSGGVRAKNNVADALRFYKEVINAEENKYLIYYVDPDEQDKEYLYYSGSALSTSNDPSNNPNNYGWIFNTSGTGYKFQSIAYPTRYLSITTSNVQTNTTGSVFNMETVAEYQYVAKTNCTDQVTITFVPGNGTMTPSNTTITAKSGDIITLPECEFNGWTFLGWVTDNVEETERPNVMTIYTDAFEVGNSDITLYAYYTCDPESVPFDGNTDGVWKIYSEVTSGTYKYANSHTSNNPATLPASDYCPNAEDWTFVNVGEPYKYYIKNEAGKYLTPESNTETGFTFGSTPQIWNIESAGNDQYKIYHNETPDRLIMCGSTAFYNSSNDNINNPAWHLVFIGGCINSVYTTDPQEREAISVTGTLQITSAVGQTVKAADKITLTIKNMPSAQVFNISADNLTFYDEENKVITSLQAGNNGSLTAVLSVAYTPIVANKLETPQIKIEYGGKIRSFRNVSARSLPATFAIVAKVGNLWYALPSQGLNSTIPPAAYPVEVDDMADPTAVTAVPANADWSLRQVYASSGSNDRFTANGDNLVFVNNASPAMTLNASSSEEENYLLTDAQYANYYQTNPGLYEWTPTTTDLETYQLTNEQRSRTLSVNIATVFGVHAQDKAVEQVRFLPIQNRYTPAALQVVEWKENSVVIMYNGDPAQTASVSVNGAAAQNTTLSAAQRDIAVYEIAAPGLAANPTQQLSITIGTEKVILSIPYIISGAQTDLALLPGSTVAARQEVAKVSDLVILKDATLTADGAKSNLYKFRNVTIYGGGKLVIPSEAKGFGVASLTLRAGGITDAGEYDYVYPQFELRGTFTNSAAKINYDYITDYDHWFHLVLPFAGDLTTIKYPTEFYGANVAANNKGSWQIKRYAGEIRATGNYDAWVDIETEGETSTIAGQGYIFWGAPKIVSVNGGASTRQKWGIQRITMSVTAPNAMTAENGDKAISELSSYANVPNNSGKDNDQGWNLIGNPYMVNLTDMATTGLHACKLVEVIDPATGKWNGKWEWNDETNIRYLTIPSEHFDTYTAKTVNQAVPLVAGRAFFVQLEGEANAITFAAANRASLMPALRAANDKPVDIETGIILSNETLQDEVNFWIKDGKTNDYEYNADYPKTPNNNQFNIYGVHTNGDLSWVATGPEYAAESMPIGYQVPAAGTYMLSLSEIYNSDGLDALYVTDHALSPEVTVDIMSEPYEFSVNQAETNNERFTVSVRVKAKTENGATGLDNVGADGEQIHKFIYQDKMYILHHGVIYDATGKRVITINK